ncbi:MAG: hypothetical protein WCF85_00590 [Rhodospirillaceae bacterium]
MAVPLLGLEQEAATQAAMAKVAGGTAGAAVVAMPAASSGAQAVAASGTIWSGKGLSLGLGLGLGAWGPVLVVAAGAAATYAYLEYRRRQLGSDEEIEQSEQDEGFYPAQG